MEKFNLPNFLPVILSHEINLEHLLNRQDVDIIWDFWTFHRVIRQFSSAYSAIFLQKSKHL